MINLSLYSANGNQDPERVLCECLLNGLKSWLSVTATSLNWRAKPPHNSPSGFERIPDHSRLPKVQF